MKGKLEKLIEYLFYLFIFLLPWQTTLILREPRLNKQVWEYGKINLYGVDLLLILIFFLWLICVFLNRQLPKGKIDRKKLPLFLLSVLFVLWAASSSFWAADKLLAFYWTVKVAGVIALFWLILNLNLNFNYLALSFILGGVIQALLAAWQFINQQTFAFKWLGLVYHNMAEAGTSVVQTDWRRWLRAYGGLPHPNILGGFLLVAELLTISFYLKLYEKLEKLWTNEKKVEFKKMVWPILGALTGFAIIFIGLIFSFSRAAWLGLILAFILFYLYCFVQKNKSCLVSLFKLNMVALLIFSSLFLIYQEPFLSRFQGQQKLEQQSLTERTTYQKQSQNLREKHFWFGVGMGNYTLAVYQQINKNYPARFYQPVHNVYLLIWSELGLIGLALFLSIIFYSLFLILNSKFLISVKKNKINLWTLSYLAIFISFLVMMFFDHWLWSSHFGVLLFWLILALSLKTKELEK
jgi:O-antigen ligase